MIKIADILALPIDDYVYIYTSELLYFPKGLEAEDKALPSICRTTFCQAMRDVFPVISRIWVFIDPIVDHSSIFNTQKIYQSFGIFKNKITNHYL